MTTAYTSLLGFALPVSGELSGTWGDTVNNSITQLEEDAIAGVATASVASANWTLSTTASGATNEARKAILIPTGSPGVSRNILAPNTSKAYIVVNQSNAAVVLKGSTGPTTGVTIATGTTALCAWNGSDFVIVSQNLGNASGVLPVANGGTNASTASITSFNNITGYTAAGATGTTSTNLVFSTSPTLVTPLLGTPTSGNLSNCTQDGTTSVGFLSIPQNSQSAAYTTVLADSGKCIFHPASDANARTFTIAANSSVAYPIGTVIQFINMSASAVTIACNTDTLTWAQGGGSGSRTLAQYGVANVVKVGTTQWLLTGTNVT